MLKSLIDKARKLGQWQQSIITKQKLDEGEIPHPAAAPTSTDQEAGGQSTTPDGDILNENRSPEPEKRQTQNNKRSS